ncbi:hypothetical protein [Niallia sp.]|uniref:hypothetical protein n=1 Tax=Niallia sp. TaxID=2837523 RepID=UPI00289AF547|nr:hypothetical protein [Niallia sp.]
MKKLVVGILGVTFLLGAGTYTFAQVTDNNGAYTFEQMKPYIKKMHPNLTAEEQEKMYNSCQSSSENMMQNGDMMQGTDAENMMENENMMQGTNQENMMNTNL